MYKKYTSVPDDLLPYRQVCVCERERECVCVCVCERERERERVKEGQRRQGVRERG